MTRKEEIEQTAIAYAEKAVMSPKDDYVISAMADYDHGCIDGFNAGAQWADRLPTFCRRVLGKRMRILREKVLLNSRDEKVKAYYQGKCDAYEQAIVLLSESLESIRVELEM